MVPCKQMVEVTESSADAAADVRSKAAWKRG